ncbi:MAG: hypothetical protein QXU82_01420 [Candidatus Aenigmatarchaeota archaeon]
MSGYRPWRKGKGGIFYLTDIFTFITSLFGTLTMLFIAALVMFIMHVNVTVYVNGVLLYDSPNADNIMISYLETTDHGYRIRDLLTYSVSAGSTNFTLNGNEIDLKRSSAIIMSQLTDKPYTLMLEAGGRKTELARMGVHTEHAVRTEYVVQAGKDRAALSLWSG